MTPRIFLSDHGGDFEAFCSACYQCYMDFWDNCPQFGGKDILRALALENGREKVFWGIVEGHDNQKQFENLERYEKIPCLAFLIQAVALNDADVKWFRIRHKGKLRVQIFSKAHRYLMVLQERKKVFDFVTAHPISQRQLDKKMEQYEASLKAENGVL